MGLRGFNILLAFVRIELPQFTLRPNEIILVSQKRLCLLLLGLEYILFVESSKPSEY